MAWILQCGSAFHEGETIFGFMQTFRQAQHLLSFLQCENSSKLGQESLLNTSGMPIIVLGQCCLPKGTMIKPPHVIDTLTTMDPS